MCTVSISVRHKDLLIKVFRISEVADNLAIAMAIQQAAQQREKSHTMSVVKRGPFFNNGDAIVRSRQLHVGVVDLLGHVSKRSRKLFLADVVPHARCRRVRGATRPVYHVTSDDTVELGLSVLHLFIYTVSLHTHSLCLEFAHAECDRSCPHCPACRRDRRSE